MYYKKNKLTKDKISILVKIYHIYRGLWINRFELLSRIIYRMTYLIFGCNIPPTVEFEEGVNIAHPIGIVIHQNAKIGKNTMIYQNVTIGRRNGDLEESPIIGSDCLIGAGACILGAVRIGDRVKVGANAVVVHDIPDDCTVVGVPGRIIRNE